MSSTEVIITGVRFNRIGMFDVVSDGLRWSHTSEINLSKISRPSKSYNPNHRIIYLHYMVHFPSKRRKEKIPE